MFCTTKCGTHFELELKLAHVTFTCSLLPFLVFSHVFGQAWEEFGWRCLLVCLLLHACACFCLLVLAIARGTDFEQEGVRARELSRPRRGTDFELERKRAR